MKIKLLKSKLHRATVTDIHLDYEGSCAIDEDLLQAADISEYEIADDFGFHYCEGRANVYARYGFQPREYVRISSYVILV